MSRPEFFHKSQTLFVKIAPICKLALLVTSIATCLIVVESQQMFEIAQLVIPKQGTDSIEKAVHKSALLADAPSTDKVYNEVKRLDSNGKWAFGIINIARINDGHWTRLWIAQKTERGWIAAVDFTPGFLSMLKHAPNTVVNQQEKASFSQGKLFSSSKSLALAGDNTALLSLPWTAGQSWNYNSGPHVRASGSILSALDFAGGDQKVMASRDGIAYTNCNSSQVYIRHADGWQTSYYHLQNTKLFNGTSIGRGVYLGDTGITTGCGGSATGRHVHFSLQRNGIEQSWNGRDVGGWTIYNGSQAYQGSAVKNGRTVYANATAGTALLYNDGSYSGNPPSSSALKTYSVDGYALNTNNNFVRLDGYPIMSSWQHNVNNSDPDQQFEHLSGATGTLLKHKTTGGCLNAHYRYNGAQMNVWNPCNVMDPDQNWTLTGLGDGTFQIKLTNTNNPGYCVDMPNRINGGKIHLWQCDSNNRNQRWKSN